MEDVRGKCLILFYSYSGSEGKKLKISNANFKTKRDTLTTTRGSVR